MEQDMQLLSKSGRNVIISCVDLPCICNVLYCIIVPPVYMCGQDACTVHYFVSSKNNDSYHFQHLPSVWMPPRLTPSFGHNLTLQTSNHLLYNQNWWKLLHTFVVEGDHLSLQGKDDLPPPQTKWSQLYSTSDEGGFIFISYKREICVQSDPMNMVLYLLWTKLGSPSVFSPTPFPGPHHPSWVHW